MTVATSILRVDQMADAVKGALEKRRSEGLLREGELFSSLSYYELDHEERALFTGLLQGFHIPGTDFQLTRVDARDWFIVAPGPTRPT